MSIKRIGVRDSRGRPRARSRRIEPCREFRGRWSHVHQPRKLQQLSIGEEVPRRASSGRAGLWFDLLRLCVEVIFSAKQRQRRRRRPCVGRLNGATPELSEMMVSSFDAGQGERRPAVPGRRRRERISHPRKPFARGRWAAKRRPLGAACGGVPERGKPEHNRLSPCAIPGGEGSTRRVSRARSRHDRSIANKMAAENKCISVSVT